MISAAVALLLLPLAITGGELVQSCGWPSVAEAYYQGLTCDSVLVHPQVMAIDADCFDYDRDLTTIEFRFGEQGFGAFTVSVPPEACRFDGPVGFCELPTPLPIPYAPIIAGCELAELQVGSPVTIVGHGSLASDEFVYIKRSADVEVTAIGDGTFLELQGDAAPCSGDRGSGAFAQLSDGSWRTVAVALSFNCHSPSTYAALNPSLDRISTELGLDLSPCHDALQLPEVGEACGRFMAGPDGGGASWDDLCTTAPTVGQGGVCSSDDDPPAVSIVAPRDDTEFDAGPAALTIEVDADDVGHGLRDVRLEINGEAQGEQDTEPPYTFELVLPDGEWDVVALARDWGGNVGRSESVVLLVGDPPPADDGTTGTGPAPDPTDGSSAEASGSGGAGESGDAQSSSEGAAAADPALGRGCGCRSSEGGGRWWMLLGLIGLRRRRRRAFKGTASEGGSSRVAKAGLIGALAGILVACGSDASEPARGDGGSSTGLAGATQGGPETLGGSVGATTNDASTGRLDEDSGADDDASTGSESTSGDTSDGGGDTSGAVEPGPAGPGWEACVGVEGQPCTLDAGCIVNMYETLGACSAPCGAAEDCPAVGGGNAVPVCAAIGAGQCVLDCSGDKVCPDDMVCAGDVCLYYVDLPQDGQCPDDSLVGAPQSVSGTIDGMGDDLAPSCWYNYEDVAVEFTAQEAGWYHFDAEHPDVTVQSMSVVDDCGGAPRVCRSGFAQFIAEAWLELGADEAVVVSLDGAGDYQLDIEFVGEAADGHCCFGSLEGCDNEVVADCVCAVSPQCCEGAWDAQCATLARTSCDANCPAAN